ncbi:MAG: 4a-hydroxytetrahydrobiopterin dehydratase [Candidatus Saccharibacteria bacterium]|jgi:4a-hydroxytetrahydrobiopterin dehydratase
MWQETNNELHKQFIFKDFVEAFGFMTQVAEVAEKQQHHPRWQNVWNKVDIWLSTHESGNIVSEKDHELANAIDKIITKN